MLSCTITIGLVLKVPGISAVIKLNKKKDQDRRIVKHKNTLKKPPNIGFTASDN